MMSRPSRWDTFLVPGMSPSQSGQATDEATPNVPPPDVQQQSSTYGLPPVAPPSAQQQQYYAAQIVIPVVPPADSVHWFNSPRPPVHQHGEEKIMRPGPEPYSEYLDQAAEAPETLAVADRKLIILDLNGTLLVRPNRNHPQQMHKRTSLAQFLKYLFDNFAVMVWSSARRNNVYSLARNGFGGYYSRLVAIWARENFGLGPEDFHRNVQVYKDLDRVWWTDSIQRHMPGYEHGERFNQSNTILIDDSAIKAQAQPWNLVEIPSFVSIEDESTKDDILAQVAGYLEELKIQKDVSKFCHKMPFRANGTWKHDWAQAATSHQPFDVSMKVFLLFLFSHHFSRS